MEISSTQPTVNSALIPETETKETVISSDFETFLQMLTVQLENQDPLNPTESTEFATQLAQFSSVEQQVLTNDLLEAMTLQMNTTGMAQMADWVGKEARASMPAYFNGTPITIAPNPATVADRVELIVFNDNGDEVQRYDIPKSSDPIEWSGTSADGSPLPDGTYTFNVVSWAAGEQLLNERADVYARVTEVRSENGSSALVLTGGVQIDANNVSALRDG